MMGQGQQIDFTETIEKEIVRLNAKEDELNTKIQELQKIFSYGLEDADGNLHTLLDEFMWGEIKVRLIELTSYLGLFLGAQPQDKRPNLNVLPRLFPELSRIVTVQRGQSTVTREISAFRKDEGAIEEKKGKEQIAEAEPVQLIQTEGQSLPNLYALFEGDVGDRYAAMIHYLKICPTTFNALYIQASLVGDKGKKIALQDIEQALMPVFVDMQAIYASAFEMIRANWRQLSGSLARAQMAMTMPWYPEERRRREYAHGYMPEEIKDADMVMDVGEDEARQAAYPRRRGGEKP